MKRVLRTMAGLFMVAVMVAASGCGSGKLSFDDLRLRYFNRLTGQGADLADPVVVKRLAAIDAGVETPWATMNKAADREYLWNDRDAQDDSISPFRPASITTAIGRLSHMAVAWATPGSKYYRNEELKKDVMEGMEWMYANKWSPKHPMYGNWWDWIIGMTYSVNNYLVAFYDEMSEADRMKFIEALDYYAPGVTYEGASTGANKIWQCYSMILRGILAKDADKIKMGVSGIDTEFKYVTTHDGFYEDGSYLQHQWHPYTGGYGAGMLSDVVKVIQMVEGSKWAVSQDHVTMLGRWVEVNYLPLIYRGAIFDMVRGREIARQAASDRSTGHRILMSAYDVAMLSPADVRNRILPRVKFEVEADTFRDFVANSVPTWQLNEVRAFLADPSIQPQDPTPYLKQFPMMDRVVQARPDFALGLAMSSTRIENYESIDSENMMAWHTGDGVTYLYNGDLSAFTDTWWPTVDWYRLPGITLAQQQHEVKSLIFGEGVLYADGYKSPHRWVGGSSVEGQYGISGMWFKDEKSALQAKKTWFMVENEVACLGAGVTSSDDYVIETVVENRKIGGDAAQARFNGAELTKGVYPLSKYAGKDNWAHFTTAVAGTDMGYYFPEGANVKTLREDRTGSWRDFSKYGNPTPITEPYFTMWIDHGRRPQDATYAYVLLPGRDGAATAAYAGNPNMKILVNSPTVQAVQAQSQGVTGLNFWESGSAAGISVSAPASVTLRESDTELVIGLSDPTQIYEGAITLETDRDVKTVKTENGRVKVLSTAPLKLEIDVTGGMGQTFAVAFEK